MKKCPIKSRFSHQNQCLSEQRGVRHRQPAEWSASWRRSFVQHNIGRRSQPVFVWYPNHEWTPLFVAVDHQLLQQLNFTYRLFLKRKKQMSWVTVTRSVNTCLSCSTRCVASRSRRSRRSTRCSISIWIACASPSLWLTATRRASTFCSSTTTTTRPITTYSTSSRRSSTSASIRSPICISRKWFTLCPALVVSVPYKNILFVVAVCV